MSDDIFKIPTNNDDLTDIDGKKKKGKSRADKSIEGTMDLFGDTKKQSKGKGKGKSGSDGDIFGFKAEAEGKKKGKKGKKGDLDIGNIYGDLG